MRVTEIRPGELGETERGLWDAFLQPAGRAASAFMAWPFAVAVGEVRADARVAVIEDEAGILAFLPYHRRPMGVARPIGAPFSDQHGPAVRPGAVLDLAQALKALGLTVYLHTSMPAGEGAPAGAVFESGPHFVAAFGDDPESFLARKRAEHKSRHKAFGKRVRKAEREMESVELVIGDPDRAAYDEILAIKSRQYRETGMHNVLGPAWAPAMFEQLRAAEAPGFGLVVVTFRLNGAMAAGEICLKGAGTLHSWIASYDPAYSDYAPGLQVINGLILNAGAQLGVGRLNLGGGHAHYKSVFSDPEGAFVDGAVCAAGAAGAARRATVGLWRAAETAPLGPVSALAGKLRRRGGQIAAVEPDFAGRARGVLTAISDIAPIPGRAAANPAAG